MKIMHFSDSHAGGPAEDWKAFFDKRWVGVFNYHFRRRFQHDLGLLEKAVEYILEHKPDLVVCTGDLTSTGQPGEFKKGLAPLVKLRQSGLPLLYVPGNHDCYVRDRSCVAAMREAFAYLNTAFGLKFGDLPVVRPFGDVDLLIVNESFPTNLLSSNGYLTRENSAFIEKACAAEKRMGAPVILIGHYPLIEDHPWLRIRHRLWGQREVEKLLVSGQLDLSLCGHQHLPYYKSLDANGRGEICAGSITRNKCMAAIEYCPEKKSFHYEKIAF